ncbi:MAG: TatD family hydrolase [Ginsengibacter sp.]
MKLIDTHTHLYVNEFSEDIDLVLERAQQEGVEKFYLPAIDSSENEALLSLESSFPEKIFAMAGLHPCSVKENYQEELKLIEIQLAKRKFAGMGETGLDFYWDTTFKNEQYKSLRKHIDWAIQYKIPLVLHTRNATQETIDVIKEYATTNLFGIFHCFGGTLENAKDIVSMNFSLGIGGVLTFKNSGLAEIVKEIDLAHLVLETDAPYLAPVPFRGKRNESSYLIYIANKLAEIKLIPVDEVARITSENAERIFNPNHN